MPATRTKPRRAGDAPRAKPRSDAYVGLLVLALLAQIAGGVFLYLDYQEYPDKKPPKVQDRPAAVAAPGPGQGARPPGGNPGNQPPGGGPGFQPPGGGPGGNPAGGNPAGGNPRPPGM